MYSVLIEYMDYPGQTERAQLDNPATHQYWKRLSKLLQTEQHLQLWAMRAATHQRLRNFHRKCVRILNRVTKIQKNRINTRR